MQPGWWHAGEAAKGHPGGFVEEYLWGGPKCSGELDGAGTTESAPQQVLHRQAVDLRKSADPGAGQFLSHRRYAHKSVRGNKVFHRRSPKQRKGDDGPGPEPGEHGKCSAEAGPHGEGRDLPVGACPCPAGLCDAVLQADLSGRRRARAAFTACVSRTTCESSFLVIAWLSSTMEQIAASRMKANRLAITPPVRRWM